MTLTFRALCNGGMLWCSASTSLNNDLLKNGVILEKYSDTINLATEEEICRTRERSMKYLRINGSSKKMKFGRCSTDTWSLGSPRRRKLTPQHKAWKLKQSSETKSQNLEHDWDEVMTLAKELGWSKAEDEMSRSWKEKK